MFPVYGLVRDPAGIAIYNKMLDPNLQNPYKLLKALTENVGNWKSFFKMKTVVRPGAAI
jgi:hypothetical protein